jgi:predicted lipoprotein
MRMRTGTGVPALVGVQIGPVLRGTAVRDALSFVRFTDFANQTEFAAVSNALNDRVLRDVVGPLDLDALTGRTVTVIGAASFAIAGSDRQVELVPVTLRVEGGAR